jgi:hypothetical protein
MDWVPLRVLEPFVETRGITTWWSGKPQVLGKVRLQITLNTTVAKSLVGPLPRLPCLNEYYLSEAAFRPRIFTITIEEGNFKPKPIAGVIEDKYRHRYGLRLLFDKSPYPLPEGFKIPDAPNLSVFNFDEMDEFVGRPLPQSETKWTQAMNDNSSRSTGGRTIASFFQW